jgi:hypothetical protein
MSEEAGHQVEIGPGYPEGQLRRALRTAREDADPATRRRAEERASRWRRVLDGMRSGALQVGSRTPVADLPAWVTLEVVRGGFATGHAAAGGPLASDERRVAREVGADADRLSLFEHALTPAGTAALLESLADGTYELLHPEGAALPAIAWLAAAGDVDGAVRVIDAIAPFADRLRFLPGARTSPRPDRSVLERSVVSDARDALDSRRPNARVEAMRETLEVWNPFADELLRLWLETAPGGPVAATFPDGWEDRASALLLRYASLASRHRLTAGHRRPKENLSILRAAAETQLAAGTLPARQRGLLQHAVDAMVRKRGVPGDARHTALREVQRRDALRPSFATLALILAARLAARPGDIGVDDPEAVLGPVTPAEATAFGIEPGAPMPATLRKVVARTRRGTPEDLVAHGVITSAELLAELAPRLAADTVGRAYPDPALAELVASSYEAFSRRRSLLIVTLESQVRFDELPWIAALAPHRRPGAASSSATDALVRLTDLTLTAFPATLVPSALVTELGAFAREAGLDLPLLDELAADIFTGTFTVRFLEAARRAADVLQGSLYARYYGIDYAAVRRLEPDARPEGGRGPRTATSFAALCRHRAGNPAAWGPAANGTIIEQAQILTTQNLAVLTGPFGVGEHLRLDRRALADRCLVRAAHLVVRLDHGASGRRTVKDVAYAWRHMLFHLSALPLADQRDVVAAAERTCAELPGTAPVRLRPVVAGLRTIVEGGAFDDRDRAGAGRRLRGWSTTGHWMLDPDGPGDADRG